MRHNYLVTLCFQHLPNRLGHLVKLEMDGMGFPILPHFI